MTPEQLWEKYWDIEAYGQPVMTKSDFLAAINEYGEAVRKQAVSVCMEKYPEYLPHNKQSVYLPCYDNAEDCAAAIEKMEMP